MSSIIIDRTDGLSSSTANKGPCHVGTTANIALYGLQVIDGVSVAQGDRVLVRSQTASYENGIYVVDTGQWRRAKDFSRNDDVREGTQVFVTDGATYERSLWAVISSNPVVIGTDAILFEQIIVSAVELESLVASAAASAAAAAASALAAAAAAAAIPETGDFGGPFLSTDTQTQALTALGLQDIQASVKFGHIECVPSRAWAIANYHPAVTPDYIQTAGYTSSGDYGAALYRRVASQPSHEGKLSIVLKDGTTTVWFALSERMVFPEMFGAKGDDTGSGGGTDDRVAFQNAINYSRCVFMRPAVTYRIHGVLTLPRFQQLIGLGKRSATEFWVETGQTGATRLLFTGAGTGCFLNQDAATMLSHGGMRGFVMRATGSYSYMMYFRECLDWHMEDIGMQTDSMTMHGFRSQKISFANPSWLNSLDNVSIRLPDNSTGVVCDVDWSDSRVLGCQLTGGAGSLDTGYGVRWINNQIERASYSGLQIRKVDGYAKKNSIFVGNSFDANAIHGLMFIVLNDTSGTRRFDTVVSNNNFRTEHFTTGVAGAASIGMASNEAGPGVGATYTVGPIMGNIELRTGVPQFTQTGTWSTPSNVGNMQS